MMEEVAYLDWVEEKITAAINNTDDLVLIPSSTFLLYHQEIVDGIVRYVTRIPTLVV
jgi:hypothetical protein